MQALEPAGALGAGAVEGFRLSPQQRALWAVRQGVCCRARLEGEVDAARLERSLQACVDRHEILRTAFLLLPGMTEPLQVIRERGAFSLQLHDLEALPEPERGAMADRLEVSRTHPVRVNQNWCCSVESSSASVDAFPPVRISLTVSK